MVCIYCQSETRVTNSRPQKRSNQIWRRRHCNSCGNTFTTHESADFSSSWRFLDQNDQIHPFMREKLFIDLYDSLRHRSSALEDATILTGTILNTLSAFVHHATLERAQIIEVCQTVLNNFDQPAAVHYAAYHH